MRTTKLQLLEQNLKKFIEEHYFDENLLPGWPFKKDSWIGVILQQENLFEKDGFNNLCAACDITSRDKIVYLCLTTFYDISEPKPQTQWAEELNWESFDNSKNKAWELAMSGYYWIGESLQWGGIYTDEDFIVFGGEKNFMNVFIKLNGGLEKIIEDFSLYTEKQICNTKKLPFGFIK